MKLSDLVSISPGFQRSINIVYDLNDFEKVSGYIPTERSEAALRHVLDAIMGRSDDGATMLIGTYGTGKSHLATVIGSLYSKVLDASAFLPIADKLKDEHTRHHLIAEANNKTPFLVVPISCSPSEDYCKAILNGLRRSVRDNRIDLNLKTDYALAKHIVEKWESEFPDTYAQLASYLVKEKYKQIDAFLQDLDDLNVKALELFKKIYPFLTSGAVFESYSGNLVDVFMNLGVGLRERGYRGILLVLDEFNKMLDSAAKGNQSLKHIQDIAELASRHDKGFVLHLLVTSHRTIGQYSSQLINIGAENWQQVEGRFKAIDVSNRPWEVFAMMSKVLRKSSALPEILMRNPSLQAIYEHRRLTTIFDTFSLEQIRDLIVDGCFPLHPVTAFALPRISAKLAQNERTLFTFLSGKDGSPLPEALDDDLDHVNLVLPWTLYDYFSYQLEKTQDNELKRVSQLASSALSMLPPSAENERILVKTIALFLIVGSARNLPVTEELIGYALMPRLNSSEFQETLNNLKDQKLLYIRRDNGVLCLVEPIDMNVDELIDQWRQKCGIRYPLNHVGEIINPHYVVPHRYNLQKKITRFLTPFYCDLDNIHQIISQGQLNSEYYHCDGVICYLFPRSSIELAELEKIAKDCKDSRVIFALPKRINPIADDVLRLKGLIELESEVIAKDKKASALWQLYIDDAQKHLHRQIEKVTVPSGDVTYLHNGTVINNIISESDLSAEVSSLFEAQYKMSPTINNELINKHNPTLTSRKARNRAIEVVLRECADPYKFLPSSQEVFMYQSLFEETGLINKASHQIAQPIPESFQSIFTTIVNRMKGSQRNSVSLEDLIRELLSPPFGLRKGILPVIFSALIRKQPLTILKSGTECEVNAELLDKMVVNPEDYHLCLSEWDTHLEELTKGLANLFNVNTFEEVAIANRFIELGEAMFRWFTSLPRFSRETTVDISKETFIIRRLLRVITRNPKDVLTVGIPQALGFERLTVESVPQYLSKMSIIKQELENCFDKQIKRVISRVREYLLPYGSQESTLINLARAMVKTTSSTMQHDARWANISNYINKFSWHDESSFVYGFSQVLMGIRLEDWLDATYDSFDKTLDELLLAQSQVAATAVTGPRLEIIFYDEQNQTAKTVVQEYEISVNGRLLESELESAIEDFGDSISLVERRQILMNLLKKMI